MSKEEIIEMVIRELTEKALKTADYPADTSRFFSHITANKRQTIR